MKTFRSGTYISQGSYKSFQPEYINRPWMLEDMELINMLGQADRAIGKLDMFSEYVPNIDFYISMHVAKEATQSSKIEGTQTSIDETLLDKDDIQEEKRDDWEEVQNYISATNQAIGDLKTLPFSSRLIRKTHERLLQGVRGEHKLPGRFRTSQNWIGGHSINSAVFVPPVHTSVQDLMGDLEKFAHHQEHYFPDLLKIALIHYQFETIHPFLDGNGRVGRLLISLYLVDKEILKRPILYLSDFFEKNRALYYDHLMRVRENHDLLAWCKFFLTGVIETAGSSIRTFDGILKLRQEVDTKISEMGSRSASAQVLINHLFQRPVIDAQRTRDLTGLSYPTVYKLLESLEEIGILEEITGAKRGRLYRFQQYVQLFH